jgi:hypothetical protein
MEARPNGEHNHLEGLRRHVAEAEERVGKEKARLAELVTEGHVEAALQTREVIDVLTESLAVARECLRLEEELQALRPWYA